MKLLNLCTPRGHCCYLGVLGEGVPVGGWAAEGFVVNEILPTELKRGMKETGGSELSLQDVRLTLHVPLLKSQCSLFFLLETEAQKL